MGSPRLSVNQKAMYSAIDKINAKFESTAGHFNEQMAQLCDDIWHRYQNEWLSLQDGQRQGI